MKKILLTCLLVATWLFGWLFNQTNASWKIDEVRVFSWTLLITECTLDSANNVWNAWSTLTDEAWIELECWTNNKPAVIMVDITDDWIDEAWFIAWSTTGELIVFWIWMAIIALVLFYVFKFVSWTSKNKSRFKKKKMK